MEQKKIGNIETPFLSIIIPVYNAERYIVSCIESILRQEFGDYEILLINDGSTDGSRLICDEYATKYDHIKVHHKLNGGVSSARNVGISMSKGEWLYFCDVDDEVLPGGLELLLSHSLGEDVGMVMGGYQICTDGREIYYSENVDVCETLNMSQAVETMFHPTYYSYQGYLWNKIFRRDIVISYSLLFNENIFFNEDRLFIIQYLCSCKSKTVYFTKPVYLYFKRAGGVVESLKKEFNPKLLTDFDAYLLMRKMVWNSHCSFSVLKNLDYSIADSYIRILRLFERFNVNDKETEKRLSTIIGNLGLKNKVRYLKFRSFVLKMKDVVLMRKDKDNLFV